MSFHPGVPRKTLSVFPLVVVLVAAMSRMVVAGTVVQGHVRSSDGSGLSGASVELQSGTGSTHTDSSGFFAIGLGTATTAVRANRIQAGVILRPGHLVFSGLTGKQLRVTAFSPAGRQVRRLFRGRVTVSLLVLRADGGATLADGCYLYRVSGPRGTRVFRATCVGGVVHWARTQPEVSHERESLSRRSAQDQLRVSKSGFRTATVPLTSDTTLGIVVTLYPEGINSGEAVKWSVADRSLRTSRLCADHTSSFYKWLGGNIKAYNNDCSSWQSYEVTYSLITLSNGLIEVDIAPQLGLRVLAARDVTGGTPVGFFTSDSPTLTNEWLRGSGGVEPSFPFFESGTGTVDQQGGYRVIEKADGSVTVAMNMRMDHRQTEMDMGFLGKYGDRPLSAWVTVRPGSNMFELTYRAENHNSTRRSNRIWNNTFFPPNATEVLFPVYWAADHAVADHWVVNGNPTNGHNSDFGLFPRYPFCGMWYQDPGVNRLRIADPTAAPGMKIYDQIPYSYYEIWGSTNAVFEVPEGFVREYEPLEMTHKYYVTKAIGKVAYANEHVAISLPSAGTFEMIATRPGHVTVKTLDGTTVVSGQLISPTNVVSGSFSDGLVVVLDGVEVFRGSLPLELDRSTAGLDSLRLWSDRSWGIGDHNKSELSTAAGFEYARNIEMECAASKWWTLSAFAVAFLDPVAGQQESVPASQVLSAANTCYRLGRLDMANVWARLVNFKEPMPEADYLLGLIAWEKDDSVDFGSAGTLANYHRALRALRNGDRALAVDLLREYIAAYPCAFRPRLALAYLTSDLDLAMRCSMENPGSPEALAVLRELGYGPAGGALETLVDTATGSDVALADFVREITTGQWRHGRRYEHDHPMLEDRFGFPNYLKY